MKRVLIISYYWPPSGGSGVQRWLKMSKYFPEFGWQPVIYTAENAEYPVEDLSLAKDITPLAEVIKRPINEPYSIYKRFLGKKKEETIKAGFIKDKKTKSAWKENASIWIRGNFFIPDARCWWIKPSVKYLLKYLKQHPVDAIISTGPPHSMHIIGMKLHEKTQIPWIADFRDPWTEIYYYQDLKISKWADRKQHQLENKTLTSANKVVTVGWTLAKDFERLGATNVDVITNGFDNKSEITEKSYAATQAFVMSYTGIIPPKTSICIWEALSELIKENQEFAADFRLKIIGQMDDDIKNVMKSCGLEHHMKYMGYLPYDKVAIEQLDSQLLLLLAPIYEGASGMLTGKLFEYLNAKRPILAICSENGDIARVLDETGSGSAVDFYDRDKMKSEILNYYRLFKEGKTLKYNDEKIDQYSRRNLAVKYCNLLNSIKC